MYLYDERDEGGREPHYELAAGDDQGAYCVYKDSGGTHMIWRTSIGMFNGTPPTQGTAGAFAAIVCARVR